MICLNHKRKPATNRLNLISIILSIVFGAFSMHAYERNGYTYVITKNTSGGVTMTQSAIQTGRTSSRYNHPTWYCNGDSWSDNGLWTYEVGLDVSKGYYGNCTELSATGASVETITKFDVAGIERVYLGYEEANTKGLTIEPRAFERASKTITYIRLNKGVSSIEDYAFCNMTSGIIYGDMIAYEKYSYDEYHHQIFTRDYRPPYLSNTAFNEIAYENVLVIVPDEAIAKYRNSNWNAFKRLMSWSEYNFQFSFSSSSYTLEIGEKKSLTFDENFDESQLTWESSDNEIATVENGIVTGNKAGEAIISATYINGYKARCNIKVIQPVTGLEINAPNAIITNGEIELYPESTQKLEVTVLPENATDKNIEWSTSNAEIAIVENNILYAISPGRAKLTATATSGVKSSINVIVHPIVAAEITINPTHINLRVSEKTTPRVTITPDNVTDKTLTWNSSNPAVATVTDSGEITALSLGQSNITVATVNGITANCVVDVVATPVESIALNRTMATLRAEETVKIYAIIQPETATDKSIFWESNDNNIATVDENGLITGISVGNTSITANTVNGLSASCIVDVVATPAESIVLSAAAVTVNINDIIKIDATIYPETTTDKSVYWTSLNPKIATVDENGTVTGISVGSTTIVATTANGIAATCSICVIEPVIPISSIMLATDKITGFEGEQVQLSATILPENATNKNLGWVSSNEEIATASQNGLISLLKKGEAIIKVSAEDGSDIIAECAVIVSKASGIDEVLIDRDCPVKIYDLKGTIVYEGIYADARLTPGLYIILCKGRQFKATIE